eukprot:1890478-Rhodomonas_salina.2
MAYRSSWSLGASPGTECRCSDRDQTEYPGTRVPVPRVPGYRSECKSDNVHLCLCVQVRSKIDRSCTVQTEQKAS